eukprot:546380-Rhodomonas_salina.2
MSGHRSTNFEATRPCQDTAVRTRGGMKERREEERQKERHRARVHIDKEREERERGERGERERRERREREERKRRERGERRERERADRVARVAERQNTRHLSTTLPEYGTDLPRFSTNRPENATHLPDRKTKLPQQSTNLPLHVTNLPDSCYTPAHFEQICTCSRLRCCSAPRRALTCRSSPCERDPVSVVFTAEHVGSTLSQPASHVT